MPLNIKDPAVHDQARSLAAKTGTTIARAVAEAIAEKLARLEAQEAAARPAKTAEALLALGQACARHTEGAHSADHADLYDADGLPR